jgi:amidohydrolase
LLNNHRNALSGTIKLVFQPGEEGLGGAARMVSEGVLENPRPDYSLALHLWNEKPFGWLGISVGPVMAASELFKVKITGKGGHGAVPHATIDPLLAAAQVITALQSIVSRNTPPLESSVVSTTKIRGGDSHNVIPAFVEMEGTIRSFKPEIRQMVLQRFDEIVRQISGGMGCRADISCRSITPAVINHAHPTAFVREAAGRILPQANIQGDFATMGSEDMAFMMQDIPGCYFFIGSSDPQSGLDAPHHNPKFDFDERALVSGAALISSAALALLKE